MILVAFILGFFAGALWLQFTLKHGPTRIFGKKSDILESEPKSQE